MFCTNCGKELGPDVCFCTSCGAKVTEGSAAKPMAGNGGEPMPAPQGESRHEASFGYDAYGEAILNYIKKNPPTTKNVAVEDAITNRLLADYQIKAEEHPYIVINKRNLLCNLRNYGLVITDRGIHYRALGEGFFKNARILFAKVKDVFVDWHAIRHFQVGELDDDYSLDNPAYLGHCFEINHKSIGLVRMGTGIRCDDKVTELLNGLSSAMVEAGLLNDLPTEYEWQ